MLALVHTPTVLLMGFPFESGHTVALCLTVQVILLIWIISCRCWPPAWQRISVKGVWWLRTGASSWWTRSWAAWSSLRCTAGRRRLPTTSKVRQHSTAPTQTVALTQPNRKWAYNDGDWGFRCHSLHGNQRIISVALHCIQRNTFPNPLLALSFLSPPSLKCPESRWASRLTHKSI